MEIDKKAFEIRPGTYAGASYETRSLCSTYIIKAGELKTVTLWPIMGQHFIIKNFEIIMPELWPDLLKIDFCIIAKEAYPLDSFCAWKALSPYAKTLNQHLYYWRDTDAVDIMQFVKFMFTLNKKINFDIAIMAHGQCKYAL